MHSSSGKAIPIAELAACYPPETIWWMIAHNRPEVTVKFDPARSLFDESRLLRQATTQPLSVEDAEAAEIVRQAVEVRPDLVEYPWDHLVTAGQIGQFNTDATLRVLHRSTAYRNATVPVGDDSLQRIRRWLAEYGQEYRIQLREDGSELPALEETEERVRVRLLTSLDQIEWEATAIHRWIRRCAEEENVDMAVAFRAVYMLTLLQPSGPKAGWFLETLGRDTVRGLLL
jgi:lysyl-tRNA synthetase class 1